MAKKGDPRGGRTRGRKTTGSSAQGRSAAAKIEKIQARNEKRRARNADKPGQGEAGNRHIDSLHERDRGPVGTKGQTAPGQSRPGRR
jgi:hypothetical protein